MSITRNHSVDFNQSYVVISFRRHTHANVRPSGTYGDRGDICPHSLLTDAIFIGLNKVMYVVGTIVPSDWNRVCCIL